MDGAYICSSSFTCCKGSVWRRSLGAVGFVPELLSSVLAQLSLLKVFSPLQACVTRSLQQGTSESVWECESLCVCVCMRVIERVCECVTLRLSFLLSLPSPLTVSYGANTGNMLCFTPSFSHLFLNPPLTFFLPSLSCHSEPSFFSDQSKSLLLFMSSHTPLSFLYSLPPSVFSLAFSCCGLER